MKLEIGNAFLTQYGEDDEYQAYLIEFDLMNNTIENAKIWSEFFKSINDGEPVILTIERKEK